MSDTTLSPADAATLRTVPGVVVLDDTQDDTLCPGEHSAAAEADGAWMVARGVPADADGTEGLPTLPAGLVWVCAG